MPDEDSSQPRSELGTHTLNGTRAVAFARTRHGIGDGSDLLVASNAAAKLWASLDQA